MLLAMVLTMAILPAAGTLAYITRSDLAAALDDYHRIKASYAAQGALALVEADLLNGGDGQISWPAQDISLIIEVIGNTDSWYITVTAHCSRAMVKTEAEIPIPREEDNRKEHDSQPVHRTVSIPKWLDTEARAVGLSLSRVLQDALSDRLR